ncbi:hypothetical protein CSB92_4922 [Pseudomonas aeruginosa]|nr:hypothetical protein CSC30_5948 [Pseudomonas aeruginosa]AWF69470.1 hypothetical protein CSC27_1650 [Pseudomonas aeruginosa]AZP59690.1 Uncharacterized protein PA1840_2496 [Pseudomonas aeruginosa]PRW16443.1 hypothetical protein CSB92_4922 [Pseudomonas aeruginosa]QLJ89955.1 putative secreted protein [Pseudomonas aeruginosa]
MPIGFLIVSWKGAFWLPIGCQLRLAYLAGRAIMDALSFRRYVAD